MSEDVGAFANAVGRIAYEFSLIRPMIPTYVHLILSALFPIVAGAHASLSRPSSAAKTRRQSKTADRQDDDDDEEEEVQKMEGLSPSDALMFPLLAGCTLAGLYFLIKWLQDPTILNKLLNGYFAFFGVFSVAKLICDFLDFMQGFVYPRKYVSGGALWEVSGADRQVRIVSGTGGSLRVSPLPGLLSRLPLPSPIMNFLWSVREIPCQKWTVKLYVHKIAALRAKLGTNMIVAALAGLASVVYFNTVSKPWFLTNLMGFAFSYAALQIMSPTTFATGSLILSALFFYDIYFVFYTPMMVTVAKTLDIPIKLVFPRPPSPTDADALPSFAMLGLGDVVLPGILIGLALRFDLYLFYLRKQTKVTVTKNEKETVEVLKATYTSLSNRWGENFWTHSWLGRPLAPEQAMQNPTTFPKPYFYASLTGYIAGMLATLVVMHIFEHAQPALLYLVPGVLISTWTTALVRGELRAMWEFSEAVEDEQGSSKDSKTGDRHAQAMEAIKSWPNFFTLEELTSMAYPMNARGGGGKLGLEVAIPRRREREVFSLTIEAPFKLSRPGSVGGVDLTAGVDGLAKNSSSDATFDDEGQPVAKRARHV
ncbi:hypothetical protein EJ05DRAFT_458001 [Pseudovirgaria hyperparasitica]|uniref:Intramembrane protease 2 n=1 Tax=Pseudovirgaria hyperparasitica TaxID=470096 RepID=A0A6A6VU86_9PEZI|nr:uncharacterized protein EJ05DRAFT_458001 [Pseudovirgaria hyperparasitica]KAF2753459.1 hypothetical protein EJ05DRAFT_458001 [Pseudovirgaria hyperparasitica]